MDNNSIENEENINETANILANLPLLTGYPNWGEQKIPTGWLVWATDQNGVITALTFTPNPK